MGFPGGGGSGGVARRGVSGGVAPGVGGARVFVRLTNPISISYSFPHLRRTRTYCGYPAGYPMDNRRQPYGGGGGRRGNYDFPIV